MLTLNDRLAVLRGLPPFPRPPSRDAGPWERRNVPGPDGGFGHASRPGWSVCELPPLPGRHVYPILTVEEFQQQIDDAKMLNRGKGLGRWRWVPPELCTSEADRLRLRLRMLDLEPAPVPPVPDGRKPLPGPSVNNDPSIRVKSLGTLPLPSHVGSSVRIPDPMCRGFQGHRDASTDALRMRVKVAMGVW